MNKRSLLYFLFLAFGRFSVAQQAPIFPLPSTFPIYQPVCSSCDYLATGSVSGDFNGDGKLDLAYIEIASSGTHDTFLVVAFGQASGTPNQVATDLPACSASSQLLAVADVNHDGHLDVVIPCGQGYTATLLGNGDGTFQAPILSPLPPATVSLVLADFNADGLPDIAYSSFSVGSSGVTAYAIALNQGGGQFGTPKTYSLTTGPGVIKAGDFNGDGKQDLAFVTGYVLGNGDGTFGQEQTLPTGISSFAVGDFNHDGFSDLAYSLSSQSTGSAVASLPLYLLSGSSSGLTSTPAAITSGGFQDASLQAVDLTGNGDLDLVASSYQTSILLGAGDGSFSSPIGYSFATSALADVNADGVVDLVAVGGSSVAVALGNGNGTVQAPPSTMSGTPGALVDMNGDGLTDVVSKSSSNSNSPQVYLSTGDGRFTLTPPASGASTSDFGQFIEAADFTGDGHPDVISVSTGFGECHGGCPQPQIAQVFSYRGNGDGTLTYLNQLSLGVEMATGVVTGDFNRDAKQDFVVTYFDGNAGTGGALFVAGNGDGTFAAPVALSLLGHTPSQVATADLNGDNKADLVIADQAGTVISYLGNGDGTFTPMSQILSISTNAILVTDVNGDGIPDLLCISSKNLMVFPGKGDGSFISNPIFTASVPSSVASFPIIQTGDLNGDGLPDIGVSFSGLTVFLNEGNGNFLQDPNLYPAGGTGFFFARLNAKGASSGQGQSLDALVSGGANLVSLLNLRNAAPAAAPSVTVSTASGGTSVPSGQTVTVNTLVKGLGKAAPSGTVNFFVNQTQVATSSLSQNQASAQIKVGAPGLVTVQAVYGGDSNNAGATGFLVLTSVAIPTTTTLQSSAAMLAQGTSVTFTANVAPVTATGMVTFLDGTTVLGTGTLSSGAASYSTNSLAVGSHSITAAYGGDTNNAASTSPAIGVSVTAATYQLSANPATLNIVQGAQGSTVLSITPVGAYNGSVSLSCAGLPANSTCTFAPASVTFNSTSSGTPQTITLTIATNVSVQAQLRPRDLGDRSRDPGRILFASIFLLPGVLLMNSVRRKSFIRLIALVLFTGGVFVSLSGCSGSAPQPKGSVTPVGTSMVTVSPSALPSGPSLSLTVNISQ